MDLADACTDPNLSFWPPSDPNLIQLRLTEAPWLADCNALRPIPEQRAIRAFENGHGLHVSAVLYASGKTIETARKTGHNSIKFPNTNYSVKLRPSVINRHSQIMIGIDNTFRIALVFGYDAETKKFLCILSNPLEGGEMRIAVPYKAIVGPVSYDADCASFSKELESLEVGRFVEHVKGYDLFFGKLTALEHATGRGYVDRVNFAENDPERLLPVSISVIKMLADELGRSTLARIRRPLTGDLSRGEVISKFTQKRWIYPGMLDRRPSLGTTGQIQSLVQRAADIERLEMESSPAADHRRIAHAACVPDAESPETFQFEGIARCTTSISKHTAGLLSDLRTLLIIGDYTEEGLEGSFRTLMQAISSENMTADIIDEIRKILESMSDIMHSDLLVRRFMDSTEVRNALDKEIGLNSLLEEQQSQSGESGLAAHSHQRPSPRQVAGGRGARAAASRAPTPRTYHTTMIAQRMHTPAANSTSHARPIRRQPEIFPVLTSSAIPRSIPETAAKVRQLVPPAYVPSVHPLISRSRVTPSDNTNKSESTVRKRLRMSDEGTETNVELKSSKFSLLDLELIASGMKRRYVCPRSQIKEGTIAECSDNSGAYFVLSIHETGNGFVAKLQHRRRNRTVLRPTSHLRAIELDEFECIAELWDETIRAGDTVLYRPDKAANLEQIALVLLGGREASIICILQSEGVVSVLTVPNVTINRSDDLRTANWKLDVAVYSGVGSRKKGTV